LCGQIYGEGVGVEGQQGVVAHQVGQSGQALDAELAPGRLEGSVADPVGAEELTSIVHHGGLIRRHGGQLSLVPDGINQGVAQPLPAPGGRVGIPDVLAIHFPAVVIIASS